MEQQQEQQTSSRPPLISWIGVYVTSLLLPSVKSPKLGAKIHGTSVHPFSTPSIFHTLFLHQLMPKLSAKWPEYAKRAAKTAYTLILR
jgi:hypothetical protein